MTSLPPQDTVPTDVGFYKLQYNLISSLKNNSFQKLTFLDTLNLISNNLKYNTIDIDAFRGLHNLRFLQMDKNGYLSKLLSWFDDLVSLEMLQIRHCGLRKIYPKVFNHCRKIIKIDLTQNLINYIDFGTFQNLPVLKYLYLDNNQITSIPPQAFKGLSQLQGMSLDNNLLTTIKEDVELQNLTQLQFLNVAYNKYLCNCDLVWFRKWIGTTNVTIEDVNHTDCRLFRDSKEYKYILEFDPDKLHCSKLDRILRITIPSASAVLAITICGVLLYRYRFHLRYWTTGINNGTFANNISEFATKDLLLSTEKTFVMTCLSVTTATTNTGFLKPYSHRWRCSGILNYALTIGTLFQEKQLLRTLQMLLNSVARFC
ncbi:osteomodulin-like [Antedon mediterranea]|uniref:osteomodulin-like n=1 Tax=Antedon mediterranea TaxID=105859 RepID=UPI003AF7E189